MMSANHHAACISDKVWSLYQIPIYIVEMYIGFCIVIVCLVEAQRADILLTAYQPCLKGTSNLEEFMSTA